MGARSQQIWSCHIHVMVVGDKFSQPRREGLIRSCGGGGKEPWRQRLQLFFVTPAA